MHENEIKYPKTGYMKLQHTLAFHSADFFRAKLLGRVMVPAFPTLVLIIAAIMLTRSPGPFRP